MGSENNLFFDCFHFPGIEELKFSNEKDELLAPNKCAALLVALSIRKGALCPREETLPPPLLPRPGLLFGRRWPAVVPCHN